MNWSTPADLRAQVQKLWDSGKLLACFIEPQALAFPLPLRLASPRTGEMDERFDEVRQWARALRQGASPGAGSPAVFRLVERQVRHRVFGLNDIPQEAWVEDLDAALGWLAKRKEARVFALLLASVREREPALVPWLARYPHKALELANAWPRLLDIVAWLRVHPHPQVYLRQVDVASVDSKFIESHRKVLGDLFDLALPDAAIDQQSTGVAGFCKRYGFRDKSLRVRVRVLDASITLLHDDADDDVGMTARDLAAMDKPFQRVFITENEVNFLAFPRVPGSLLVFGGGYGFDMLAEVAWLHRLPVFYWGDIDTHGFAILDQLRSHLPHVQSLLMDRATLMAHEAHWGEEPQPSTRDLPRLMAEESRLYDELRDQRLRPRLRLEQERVRYGWLAAALLELPGLPGLDPMRTGPSA